MNYLAGKSVRKTFGPHQILVKIEILSSQKYTNNEAYTNINFPTFLFDWK